MKTVIITGCAGLIGNHLTRYFLKNGYFVIGIDNLSDSYLELLPKFENFTFYQFSLDDPDLSKEVFDLIDKNHKPCALYHLAGYTLKGLSAFTRNYNYANNMLCAANAINACIKYGWKIIFTSSMEIYGDQAPPFTELTMPKPIEPYGIAKYAIEMDIEQANKQFGLKYNIVRLHNVIGIYQNIWNKYKNVVGAFIKNTLDNEPMIIFGDGKQTRAFTDIKYCLHPLYLLSNNFDNDTFNIGGDKYYSINQISEIITDIAPKFNLQASKVYKETRYEAKHAFCDHSKAKNILSFNDETQIESIIEEIFVWAKNEPKRNIRNIKYEIENGMYSYWQRSDNNENKPEHQYSEIKTEYIDQNNPKRSKTIYH